MARRFGLALLALAILVLSGPTFGDGKKDVFPKIEKKDVPPVLTKPSPTEEPGKKRQPADKKEAAEPNRVEIRMADGSTVQAVLLDDHLEMATKYGKLSVPVTEVRRIEFAYRLPEEVERKINDAIKRLGDGAFDVREAAMKELAALGKKAYPALKAAEQSKDAEVSRRAKTLVRQITDKVPAEQLRFPTQDRVITAEFPIVGRLVGPTLRAKTAYFGEARLRLCDVRTLRGMANGGEYELKVDSATYGSPPGLQSLETDVTVEEGMAVEITAKGQVDLWPDGNKGYMTGPGGYGQGGRMPGGHLPGILLGRIGEAGPEFVIGERYQGTANRSGKLYLRIVPSPWNNASSGAYSVRVVLGEQ